MKSQKLLALYLFLLCATAAAMLLIRHASGRRQTPPRDYDGIRQEGVLRMITEYNPSGYYISGDTTGGFQYELSRAIAQISGLEVQMQLEMNLAESFRALANNECDIIAQNIPVTSEMKERCLFTEPVVLSRQTLVQRTAAANHGAAPIRNHPELAGKTIHVPENSPALLRLKHLEQEIGDSVHIVEERLYSSEQLAILVAGGTIDYAVCDRQIALQMRNELPGIDIDTDISFTQLQAWAVRKNSPQLLDSLNSWFGRMRENGAFDKIYKRYYTSGR